MKLLLLLQLLLIISSICASASDDSDQQLLLVLGGASDASVALYNQACDIKCSVDIPNVPQDYGFPGRTGSYATVLGDSVLVCGGLEDAGPPISSFKDCQKLDLSTFTWSKDKSMANYSANGASIQISTSEFIVFGGENTRYNGPGPTEWVDHNQIQHLDEETWKNLDTLTLNNDSFLGSCAVFHDGNVLMTDGWQGTSLVSFHVDTQSWTEVFSDVGFSAKRHGCALVLINGEEHMAFIGGDSNLAVALNLKTGAVVDLPPLSGRRPYRPIVTFISSHLIVHGGAFNGDDFQTEEALDLNNYENGDWEPRMLTDVSRINSPAVIISSKFASECRC